MQGFSGECVPHGVHTQGNEAGQADGSDESGERTATEIDCPGLKERRRIKSVDIVMLQSAYL